MATVPPNSRTSLLEHNSQPARPKSPQYVTSIPSRSTVLSHFVTLKAYVQIHAHNNVVIHLFLGGRRGLSPLVHPSSHTNKAVSGMIKEKQQETVKRREREWQFSVALLLVCLDV